MAQVFRDLGFPETEGCGFTHSTGHGVGLDVHEKPALSEIGETLQAAQVVTVEPGLYYPQIGGVRLEDLVSGNGKRVREPHPFREKARALTSLVLKIRLFEILLLMVVSMDSGNTGEVQKRRANPGRSAGMRRDQRVEVGASLLDVAEFVEGAIRSRGALPAFPCNISLDRNAAHYTPSPDDKSVFGENMVKLDVGVHVDGYIADAAITVDLSGHDKLTEASCAGLDAALELVGPGVSTATIGKAIEEAITGYGYKPVSNLTGHGLSRYLAHDEPAVPNKAMEKGTTAERWRCHSH